VKNSQGAAEYVTYVVVCKQEIMAKKGRGEALR